MDAGHFNESCFLLSVSAEARTLVAFTCSAFSGLRLEAVGAHDRFYCSDWAQQEEGGVFFGRQESFASRKERR